MNVPRFEWDSKKAASNLAKHAISFEQARRAFDDPFALLAPDETHSTLWEIREWLIGESELGILVVVFTRREKGEVIRLISARKANNRERKIYGALKGISIS